MKRCGEDKEMVNSHIALILSFSQPMGNLCGLCQAYRAYRKLIGKDKLKEPAQGNDEVIMWPENIGDRVA